jgi:hypothetical protein
MASSSQVRKWWAGYQRTPSKYVKVAFPRPDGQWIDLRVADKSAPVWKAVAQVMATEPYLFREMAGGTYHPREPGSVSLHTYALALDLNPSKNPHKNPLTTDMPNSFITRMEGIRANGKQAITWGGRWTSPSKPDAMHYQLNVSPADCINVTWDQGGDFIPEGGGDMAGWQWDKDNPEPIDDLDDARRVNEYQGWGFWRQSDFDYDENDPKALDERVKVITARMIDWMMRNPK